MSQNYSRRQKSSQNKTTNTPKKHIKKGFSAFQKTIALIGSILSIIVASITISSALKGSHTKKSDSSTKTTTVIVKKTDNKSDDKGSKTDTSSTTQSAYQNKRYKSRQL